MNTNVKLILVCSICLCAIFACGDSSNSLKDDSDSSSSGAVSSSSSEFLSSAAENEGDQLGEFTYGGQLYKTMTITSASSSITLMAENLNIGNMVLGVSDQSNDLVVEKYCYNDLEGNCDTDGGLYQWAEAMKLPSRCNTEECSNLISEGYHQGVCPVGWHIPTVSEWNLLTNTLGGVSIAGKTMKVNNTGFLAWESTENNDGNSSGYSGVPTGYRDSESGGFKDRAAAAFYWESSEINAQGARIRSLYFISQTFAAFDYLKKYGFSVRCFKDN